MATFYLDMKNGNDSNNGLTPSTPKLTMNAACALVTAYTDVVKARSTDSFQTDIGTWRWEKYGTYITADGDKTGDISANDFFCITVEASGNIVPEIYQAGTVTYDAGDDETTVTFKYFNASYHYYVHDSFTGATSKINLTNFSTAGQSCNKDGYRSGGSTPLDYGLSTVSGGWNADYDAIDGFSGIYVSTTTDILGNNFDNWCFKRLLMIGGGEILLDDYNRFEDCYRGYSTSDTLIDTDAYCGFINCKFIMSTISHMFATVEYNQFSGCTMLYTNTNITNIFDTGNYATLNNCIFGLTRNDNIWDGVDYHTVNNCVIHNMNARMIDGLDLIFNNCEFIDIGSTENINLFVNNLDSATFNNCTFDCTRNRNIYYLQSLSSVYNGITGITDIYVDFQKDYIADSDTVKIFPTPTNNCINIYTNGYDIGLSSFTNLASTTNNYIIYDATGNTKLEIYGYTQLSTDAYTGNTAVMHVVSTNNANCVFNNVDFEIDAGTSYTLSFYAKGSSAFDLEYNIRNAGEYIWSTWESMTLSTSYANESISVSSSDWNTDGTATLVFRIPSQAKGTYALIDYITLT